MEVLEQGEKIPSALDILCLISDQFWHVGPITLKEREAKVRRYKEKRLRRFNAHIADLPLVLRREKRRRMKNRLYVD